MHATVTTIKDPILSKRKDMEEAHDDPDEADEVNITCIHNSSNAGHVWTIISHVFLC